MLRKSFKAAFEQTDGGTVRAYASTFDREPDAYGDVIAKGAFTETLKKWRESGKPIPLLWGHLTDDPYCNIGACYDYGEDERGFWFEAAFDADNERAQYVRKLAAEGRVYQCSFAYEVKDAGEVTLGDGRKAHELRELEIFEISIVQIPANQNATIEEVKSNLVETMEETAAAIKAGRRNSAKDADELRRIADAANEIIETVNGLLSETTETIDGDDEREDETEGAKSQAEFVEAYKQALKTAYEG